MEWECFKEANLGLRKILAQAFEKCMVNYNDPGHTEYQLSCSVSLSCLWWNTVLMFYYYIPHWLNTTFLRKFPSKLKTKLIVTLVSSSHIWQDFLNWEKQIIIKSTLFVEIPYYGFLSYLGSDTFRWPLNWTGLLIRDYSFISSPYLPK